MKLQAAQALCLQSTVEGFCLKLHGHQAGHAARPPVWGTISDDPRSRTRKKIVKAGFATPRGGAKGGYQNHVSRSSRVIIPWEHTLKVDFSNYEQGSVVRVTVPQALELDSQGLLHDLDEYLAVDVGGITRQAFVLYRSGTDRELLPARKHWVPCYHVVSGVSVLRRASNGQDYGHYLERIPKQPDLGLPQGIFAPEYARQEANYACQVLLTHLAYTSEGAGQDENARHVMAILRHLGVYDTEGWTREGIMDSSGVTSCPLCGRRIASPEFHEMIDPSQVPGLANSGVQLAETRSTLVNLYHLRPLLYSSVLGHTPANIAWGHAHCNTFLAQRTSFTANELRAAGRRPKVDLFWDETESFIRAADGRAWVSVTPVPPGNESFTEYLLALGLQKALDAENHEEDEN